MIHLKKLIPDEPKRDGFFKGLKFDLFVDRIVKYVQDLHEQILECMNVINSVDKTERKDGKDGRGIENITLNEDNSITFGLSDNTSITTDAIHIESTVDLSGYYTKSEIDRKGYLTQHQQVDWNIQSGQAGYISNKPTKLSEFTNDENFISSPCYPIDNNYATSGGGTFQGHLELDSNKYYKLGTISQLYVDLNAPTNANKANEWVMEFTIDSNASANPTIAINGVNDVPIIWANGEVKYNAGSTYQVSVQEGLGIVVEFVPNSQS